MVMVDTAWINPAPAHPIYLRESELTSAGDAIKEFVSDVLRVSANLPALQKARRLSDAVSQAMSYEKGATDVATTAEAALAGGRGVCQDYAHVLVAACRRAEPRSLVLRCKSGISRIELEKLLYCEVLSRTLVFHLTDGRILESTGSMDELARQLAEYPCFLRPHRSFLVNMEYIRSITAKTLVLTDGAQIPIPHGRAADIKNQYLEYAFSRKQVML